MQVKLFFNGQPSHWSNSYKVAEGMEQLGCFMVEQREDEPKGTFWTSYIEDWECPNMLSSILDAHAQADDIFRWEDNWFDQLFASYIE